MIEGTDLGDFLAGTSVEDQVLAKGGDDSVFGLGGEDRIDGGPGSDRIHGDGVCPPARTGRTSAPTTTIAPATRTSCAEATATTS